MRLNRKGNRGLKRDFGRTFFILSRRLPNKYEGQSISQENLSRLSGDSAFWPSSGCL